VRLPWQASGRDSHRSHRSHSQQQRADSGTYGRRHCAAKCAMAGMHHGWQHTMAWHAKLPGDPKRERTGSTALHCSIVNVQRSKYRGTRCLIGSVPPPGQCSAVGREHNSPQLSSASVLRTLETNAAAHCASHGPATVVHRASRAHQQRTVNGAALRCHCGVPIVSLNSSAWQSFLAAVYRCCGDYRPIAVVTVRRR
jgi:hypothetical protein